MVAFLLIFHAFIVVIFSFWTQLLVDFLSSSQSGLYPTCLTTKQKQVFFNATYFLLLVTTGQLKNNYNKLKICICLCATIDLSPIIHSISIFITLICFQYLLNIYGWLCAINLNGLQVYLQLNLVLLLLGLIKHGYQSVLFLNVLYLAH